MIYICRFLNILTDFSTWLQILLQIYKSDDAHRLRSSNTAALLFTAFHYNNGFMSFRPKSQSCGPSIRSWHTRHSQHQHTGSGNCPTPSCCRRSFDPARQQGAPRSSDLQRPEATSVQGACSESRFLWWISLGALGLSNGAVLKYPPDGSGGK